MLLSIRSRAGAVLAGAALAAAGGATSASAATTVYEAENFASITSSVYEIVRSPDASGGKYVLLYSPGKLTINVPTGKVSSFAAKVRSTDCINPTVGGTGAAEYGYDARPSYYWQEDAWISGLWGYPTPRPATTSFLSASYTAFVEGGNPAAPFYWTAPGWSHPDPHKIGVTYANDYVRTVNGVRVCDRNLAIDKIIVVD